ncbi:MAG: glutathione S-transferase family protein [Betaproteobacteria bacterium]|nr:glutathione S-transferase family protein [Betaproteobacteria bacterium]
MITIYHLETSRSERIVWLMEELGLEYTLETFPRENTGASPPPLKAVHPLGKAPVIRDGDTVLAESGAIVEYLVHRHGGGRLALPPDHPDYSRYLYWLHFAEGSLMSLMLIALVLSRIPEATASPVTVRISDRVKAMMAYVESEFGNGPWIAGAEFTAADVMMAFPFTTMSRFLKVDMAPYPKINAYAERIAARPAYRKAMELAGPRMNYAK